MHPLNGLNLNGLNLNGMNLNGVKLVVSAFRLRVAHRHEWIAVGAMLTCLAVVLNLSPFAAASKREAAPTATVPSVGLASIAGSQVGADARPERFRSGAEATDLSDRIRPLTEPASFPHDVFARLVFQPVMPARQDGMPEPLAQPLATIAGVWAPDASACSARAFREGFLPTIINNDGAWAGETFCIFKNQKQTETGWRVVAYCSNPREHWTTDVRLTLKDSRLTWTSRRGTQAYTRCAPDFLITAAR